MDNVRGIIFLESLKMGLKKGVLANFLFFLILGLFSPESYAADKLALKFRPKAGKKHNVRVIAENKIKQTIGGKQQNINHTTTTGLGFEVKEVDAKGIASIKITYRSLLEKTLKADVIALEYDSTKHSMFTDNPLAPTYTALMGQSFIARVSPKGEIVELKGLNEMFSQIAEKVIAAEDELIGKASADDEEQKEISSEERAKRRIEWMKKKYGSREKRKQALKKMIMYSSLREQQIMDMVRALVPVFSVWPVGTGDRWMGKMISPTGPPDEIDIIYTLKENEQGVVIVDANSTIALDTAPAPGFKTKMAGSHKGTLEIDETSGWVIRKKEKTQLSGQITQQGMTVPVSIENTITVEPIGSAAAD